MKLVMLDGLCAGQMYDNRDAPPEWSILKPINTGYLVDEWDDLLQPEKIIYKRTFLSLDGEMALYTTDGKSERLLDSRDWVMEKRHAYRQKSPIHFMESK